MANTKRAILLAAASAVAVTAGAAQAQDSRTVETITVTAQKREQGIQDVPVAVTAYNAELLQNAGVRDIKDLAVISPGLNVTSTSNEFVTTARIRGIGTVGDNPGLESSVGIVIDGVPRARNGVGFNDLGELERIEVLRGPQGTLFGANTSAGIINVVTKRPEYDFGANLELTVMPGDVEGLGMAAGITGGISDNVAVRLYGAARSRDGFQTVQTFNGPRTQTEDANQDFHTMRGQALFDINESMSLLLSADYTERSEDCCGAPSLESGPTAGALNFLVPGSRPLPGADDPFSRVIQSNRDTTQDITDGGYSATFEWALDAFDLTVIASDRAYELTTGQDTDFTGADVVYRDASNNGVSVDTRTLEVRAAGSRGQLDWMVGGYYSEEELVRRDSIVMGDQFEAYLGLLGGSPTLVTDLANGLGLTFIPAFTPLAPGTGAPSGGGNPTGDVFNQDAESLSVFTHNTWNFTDSTNVTFGLRYTSTDKAATADFATSDVPACDVWEAVFGEALDFSTAQNQAILAGFSAGSGVGIPDLVQFGTFTCLPFSRDVYNTIGLDQSLEEEEVTGLLSLSHRFNEDLLAYGTYSRGYKAGGFNLDRFTQAGSSAVDFTGILAGTSEYPATFDPELVDSFELGFKTEWLNDTLLANLYLYYSDFETYQLNTFNGIAFFVTSIDGASTRGAELELLYLPESMPGLTMQGGLTYSDAKYEEFDPTGTPDVDRLSGQNFSLAPEWYASGSVSYQASLTDDLNWLAHLDGRWVSEQNTGSDLDPQKVQDAYALFNGRVGLMAADESWSLELWGRNLLDEDYIQVGFDGPFQPGSFNAFLGAPRTWGLTLRLQN
ncbi:TonB-dependent receptor [Maricaulis sp. D1M11]|uniref:TonB-dependent receptor n=1 Tax=Maricaulis sp. D1M11 TaxID=3076117 RepID=UPI0039B6A1A4